MTKVRLIYRPELLDRVGCSAVSLWNWMRDGKFPRSRCDPEGKQCWSEEEVEQWMANLPKSILKGDRQKRNPKVMTKAQPQYK